MDKESKADVYDKRGWKISIDGVLRGAPLRSALTFLSQLQDILGSNCLDLREVARGLNNNAKIRFPISDTAVGNSQFIPAF